MDSEQCSQAIPPVQSGGTIPCPGLWCLVETLTEELISGHDTERPQMLLSFLRGRVVLSSSNTAMGKEAACWL